MTTGLRASYNRSMKRLLLGTMVAAVLLAGCGSSSRSVLYRGLAGLTGKRMVVTDAEARRDGKVNLRDWEKETAQGAGVAPEKRFSNLSESEFRKRLATAAAKYGFTVKTVRFLHPRKLAPVVVVQTTHYLAFSHAVPAIERSLDPSRGSSSAAFEAFWLEAKDERGIPFVIVNNNYRGELAGGQWAGSEELYPFAHG
jgi:major membrane immunogen (membrane-anchored lipoprotein)